MIVSFDFTVREYITAKKGLDVAKADQIGTMTIDHINLRYQKNLIAEARGVLLYDRQMDFCDSRVTFATEKTNVCIQKYSSHSLCAFTITNAVHFLKQILFWDTLCVLSFSLSIPIFLHKV